MKVRVVLDVDEHARYIIARYYRSVDTDKTRTRATRLQVKRFTAAALRTCIREQSDEILDAKGKAVAQRLQTPTTDVTNIEFLSEPREKQRSLTW